MECTQYLHRIRVRATDIYVGCQSVCRTETTSPSHGYEAILYDTLKISTEKENVCPENVWPWERERREMKNKENEEDGKGRRER